MVGVKVETGRVLVVIARCVIADANYNSVSATVCFVSPLLRDPHRTVNQRVRHTFEICHRLSPLSRDSNVCVTATRDSTLVEQRGMHGRHGERKH